MVSFTARLTATIMHAGILSGFSDEDGHSKKKRRKGHTYSIACRHCIEPVSSSGY